MVETRLGTIIQGQMESFDQGVIFTKAFVERHTAQIRGVFSAITKYENFDKCWEISWEDCAFQIERYNKIKHNQFLVNISWEETNNNFCFVITKIKVEILDIVSSGID